MPPPPPRPRSKVSGLVGLASGLGNTPVPLPRALSGGTPPPSTGKRSLPPLRYVPGSVIGEKYRLTKVLGEGGMGAVWVARNIQLEVDVALKLIRHELAATGTSERLLFEARSAARIGHPAIVRVYDFGETEYKDPYIVMELLEGESLRQVLDRKVALQPVNAVQTLLPIASALEAAHLKGIIHRDVKPENVLLATDERGGISPKVVDFGIAKLRREEERGKKTEAGSVVGSPDYMSPEQARGRDDIDERSDVWAFAVVLYETITGSCPFEEPNYHAQLRAIIEAQPEPLWERGVHEPELWDILARGLAKEREKRWPSMRTFGTALARWLASQGIDTDVTGAMLSMFWGEATTRRPLSEPPISRDSRTSMEAVADEDDGPTRIVAPPSSGSSVAWPTRSQRPPAVAPLDPPPSSRRTPPPLPQPVAAIAPPPPPAPAPVEPPRVAVAPAPAPATPARETPRASEVARAQPAARPEPPGRRSRLGWVAGALLALAAGGFLALRFTPVRELLSAARALPAASSVVRPAASPAPPPTAAPVALETAAPPAPNEGALGAASASATATPSAAPTASATASATATASASGAPPEASAAAAPVAGEGSLVSCLAADFPPDSFDEHSAHNLAGICAQTDPRKGAIAIKTELVRAGQSHRVTDAMREWALMSWFELAAFAAVRGDCCPGAPPLTLPTVGQCEPLDGALQAVGAAARLDEAAEMDAALVRFHKAIGCVLASGASNNYTFTPLSGGEETAFKKTMTRITARHGR